MRISVFLRMRGMSTIGLLVFKQVGAMVMAMKQVGAMAMARLRTLMEAATIPLRSQQLICLLTASRLEPLGGRAA